MDVTFYLLLLLLAVALALLYLGMEQYSGFILDGVGKLHPTLVKICVGGFLYFLCLILGLWY